MRANFVMGTVYVIWKLTKGYIGTDFIRKNRYFLSFWESTDIRNLDGELKPEYVMLLFNSVCSYLL